MNENLKNKVKVSPSVNDLEVAILSKNIITSGHKINEKERNNNIPLIKKSILGGDAPNISQIRHLMQSRLTPSRIA